MYSMELTSLLQGAKADALALAHDYMELGDARLRVGARALGLGAAAAVLALVGFVELCYGIVGLLMASVPAIWDHARIVAVAGIVSLIFACIFGYAAKRSMSPKEERA